METKSKKAATLRQVAQLADVSMATASLVVNRKGEISFETRSRVLQAMETLNYVPKRDRLRGDIPVPETLNTVRFLKIARHGQTVNRDHNVFISDYIDGMSFEATRRDYFLQVVSYENSDINEILEGMVGAELSGFIALGTELTDDDIETILSQNLPCVIIDTHRPFMNGNFVNMDNDQLVYRALDYLKGNNFEKIGMVSSHTSVGNFQLRHDAFLRSMNRLDLKIDPAQILSVTSTLDGSFAEATEQLANIDTLADAYLCTNDIVAFGFIQALRRRGVSVPQDVSVIGIDNLPTAAVFEPPLTSLDVPKQKIGAMALRILDDLISNGKAQPSIKLLLAGELVVRDSVLPKS
ncbi:transcriptional regulator, LacI family [Cohaesibacter sp. ES.047]|uniref:LacI family DNA-binding transcriptional regulator n=1 Tax=Cohaesibacter sp. ES.047 TaxID=1798205 RepID=UPI000BB6AE5F|nr:LacI family DNA-binding transcriptional regulator [Cohaesibacter sp. ES.047]SNY92247.1 transcriptional regulator, LacI family [Cohaesibacter sp. ES.047]